MSKEMNKIEDIRHGLPLAIARYKSLTNSDDDAHELRLAKRDLIRYAAEDGPTLLAAVDALAKFKAYVHRRLDEAGIPVNPESPHKEQGCRIGGRLDIVLSRAAAAPDLLAACKAAWDVRMLDPVKFRAANPNMSRDEIAVALAMELVRDAILKATETEHEPGSQPHDASPVA